MKHFLSFAAITGVVGLLCVSTTDAQVRFQLSFGGQGWCAPSGHPFSHYNRVPIFSPWSPAGYLPYHNPYHTSVSRVVVPSITYSVAPSTHSVIPSAPTARVASSRPIYSSKRTSHSGELVSAFHSQAKEHFRVGDYDSALKNLNEALGVSPNDPLLRQLRALSLYAQGRYDEASELVKPLVDSGTVWDWNAMIAHYPSEDVYERQFRRLEHHVDSNPDEGNARYLLGYHYQVGGHLSAARMMFDQASGVVETSTVHLAPVPTEAEPQTSIAGTWQSITREGKTVTLQIRNDGSFTWEYEGAPTESILNGDWTLDQERRLSLVDPDVSFSGTIDMEGDHTMRFVLEGTPDDDPGLVFERM